MTILQPFILEIKVRKAINKNGGSRKENVIKSNLLILIGHHQDNFNQNLKGSAFTLNPTCTPHKRLQKESKGIAIFFKNQINNATSSKNNEILTQFQMFLAIQGETKYSHICLLDFGCTKHMTPH